MISSRCGCHASKSIHHGGDFMNELKSIGRSRVLASMAMLFGAIFTIMLLPAYGQQEVDPTWYDPWAAPAAAVAHPGQPLAVAHSSKPPIATHRYQQTVKFVSPVLDGGKVGVKDTRLDQSGHPAGYKSVGASSNELVSVASRDRFTAKQEESY
jgi:hypothetical protein